MTAFYVWIWVIEPGYFVSHLMLGFMSSKLTLVITIGKESIAMAKKKYFLNLLLLTSVFTGMLVVAEVALRAFYPASNKYYI